MDKAGGMGVPSEALTFGDIALLEGKLGSSWVIRAQSTILGIPGSLCRSEVDLGSMVLPAPSLCPGSFVQKSGDKVSTGPGG